MYINNNHLEDKGSSYRLLVISKVTHTIMNAWTCTLFISKKKEGIICEILPMEKFSTSFEEYMTLNCIKNLCLQIYQMTCKYRLDFFKGSTRTFPIFQKYFPPFPLGLFYWYVVEPPS